MSADKIRTWRDHRSESHGNDSGLLLVSEIWAKSNGQTELFNLRLSDLTDVLNYIARLEAAQGMLVDACGLALNYHQEDHVNDALQGAIKVVVEGEAADAAQ